MTTQLANLATFEVPASSSRVVVSHFPAFLHIVVPIEHESQLLPLIPRIIWEGTVAEANQAHLVVAQFPSIPTILPLIPISRRKTVVRDARIKPRKNTARATNLPESWTTFPANRTEIQSSRLHPLLSPSIRRKNNSFSGLTRINCPRYEFCRAKNTMSGHK